MGLINALRRLLGWNDSLRTESGLEVVCSVGGSEKVELETPEDKIELVSSNDQKFIYECGHEGVTDFVISVYGTKSTIIKKRDKCSNCVMDLMKNVTIRCALCGHPIFPGESVALYHKSSKLPYSKVGYQVNDSYIGCLAMGCCPSGGFFAGHWTGKEFRSAFDDGSSIAEQVFKTGQAMVCSDTNEPNSIKVLKK